MYKWRRDQVYIRSNERKLKIWVSKFDGFWYMSWGSLDAKFFIFYLGIDVMCIKASSSNNVVYLHKQFEADMIFSFWVLGHESL